eukprot:scaffold13862_cov200-Alexandrium_tamarense.AAC.5
MHHMQHNRLNEQPAAGTEQRSGQKARNCHPPHVYPPLNSILHRILLPIHQQGRSTHVVRPHC